MARRCAAAQIVVAGGGPVGLSFAALTAAAHADALEIRVVDSGPRAVFDPERVDLRVYALSRASQRLLERVGAWRSIVARRASPYRHMRVWQGRDYTHAARIDFDAADIGEPDLGHIVEDGLLRAALAERLERLPNVTLAHGAGVAAVDVTERSVALELDDGSRLDADLLVAADGVASPLRALLEMPTFEWDYGQRAVVAHVETGEPHAETAYQRFLPGGPLAFLPLADGRSSVVWSVPSARARELERASAAEFVAALETASGGMLGRLGNVSERAAFPLRALHAVRYSRHRVALAGDAAHAVHPLAGQGMNLGLLDAAALADVIAGARAAGEAFTDARVLRRYDRRRKGHNVQMLVALDALQRLFRLPDWAAPVRAASLAVVDCAPMGKRLLMRRALGLGMLEPDHAAD